MPGRGNRAALTLISANPPTLAPTIEVHGAADRHDLDPGAVLVVGPLVKALACAGAARPRALAAQRSARIRDQQLQHGHQ